MLATLLLATAMSYDPKCALLQTSPVPNTISGSCTLSKSTQAGRPTQALPYRLVHLIPKLIVNYLLQHIHRQIINLQRPKAYLCHGNLDILVGENLLKHSPHSGEIHRSDFRARKMELALRSVANAEGEGLESFEAV